MKRLYCFVLFLSVAGSTSPAGDGCTSVDGLFVGGGVFPRDAIDEEDRAACSVIPSC